MSKKGDEIRYKLDRPGATEGEMVVPDDYGVDGGSGDEGADESVEDVGATGEEVPPWRRHAGDSAGKTGTESETMRDVDDRE